MGGVIDFVKVREIYRLRDMYSKAEEQFAYIYTDIYCLKTLIDDMRNAGVDNAYRYETALVLIKHLAKKVKITEAVIRKG